MRVLMPDPNVVARIEAISNWFTACAGPASLSLDSAMLRVHTWDEARRWYSGWPWRNTIIEAANVLRLFLHNRYENEYCEWKRITKDSKEIMDRIVYPVAREYASRHTLEERFVECVGWDIGGVLLESAYAKFRPPMFFTPVILPIYEAGHFPCGWEGEWPEGRLVVI